MQIDSLLNMEQKERMGCFLKENSDVFACSVVEMLSISPSMICDSLNVNLLVRPVKQKKRKFVLDRIEMVKQET